MKLKDDVLLDIEDLKQKSIEDINAQGLRVLICAGTGCVANGSLEIIDKFKERGINVQPLGKNDKMTAIPTGCHGFCEQGVLVVIPELDVTYVKVKLDDVDEIIDSHIIGGNPVERLLYTDPATKNHVFKNEDIKFYAGQTRVSLANCG